MNKRNNRRPLETSSLFTIEDHAKKKEQHRFLYLEDSPLIPLYYQSPHPHAPFARVRSRHLSRGDGAALALSTLAGVEAGTLAGNGLGSLLNNLLALGEDHLDVAGVGHVRVDLKMALADAMSKNTK